MFRCVGLPLKVNTIFNMAGKRGTSDNRYPCWSAQRRHILKWHLAERCDTAKTFLNEEQWGHRSCERTKKISFLSEPGDRASGKRTVLGRFSSSFANVFHDSWGSESKKLRLLGQPLLDDFYTLGLFCRHGSRPVCSDCLTTVQSRCNHGCN